MRIKKQINQAENHLVVGSLKIIGDVTGSNMQTLKQKVDSMQTTFKKVVGQKKDYWKAFLDDGIITVFEKTILKKEWECIDTTYTAIMTEVDTRHLENTSAIILYNAAYKELKAYLNETLGLFDEMSEDTEIPSRETFNEYYTRYYSAESFVQSAIAIGIIGSIDFTVVDNLDWSGAQNQVVIYAGELYQWVNGHWKKIGVNGYCGSITSLPQELEGNYFLAADDFYGTDIFLIAPESKYLVAPEGQRIAVVMLFKRGFIYEYVSNRWQKISDTNDYRYIVALADYYTLTGRLPAVWQNGLDNLQQGIDNLEELVESRRQLVEQYKTALQNNIDLTQEQINATANVLASLSSDFDFTKDEVDAMLASLTPEEFAALIQRYGDDIEALTQELASKISHIPVYLGALSAVPQNAQENDWFLWIGVNGATINGVTFNKGYVYQYTPNSDHTVFTWQMLNPQDTNNSSYYMSCLDEILQQTDVIAMGTFGVLFASAFFAHSAVIDRLGVQTIILKNGGLIKSDNFVSGESGFCLNGLTGEAVFNNIICEKNGIFGGDVIFSGKIISGPLVLTNDSPITANTETHFPPNSNGYNIYNFFSEGVTYNGLINDVPFTRITKSAGPINSNTGLAVMSFYNHDTLVKKDVQMYFQDLGNGYIYPRYPNDDIYVNKYDGTVKTLRLRGIPAVLPDVSDNEGIVYRDENGFLKIV